MKCLYYVNLQCADYLPFSNFFRLYLRATFLHRCLNVYIVQDWICTFPLSCPHRTYPTAGTLQQKISFTPVQWTHVIAMISVLVDTNLLLECNSCNNKKSKLENNKKVGPLYWMFRHNKRFIAVFQDVNKTTVSFKLKSYIIDLTCQIGTN